MGLSLFIGPFDPALWQHGDPIPTTDFRINPGQYSNQLLVRWPYAKSYPGTLGSWTLDEPNEPGTPILLHSDWLYVSFAPGANVTDFILWHRHFVPSQSLLLLFQDSSWASLKLHADTTRHAIQTFTRLPTRCATCHAF